MNKPGKSPHPDGDLVCWHCQQTFYANYSLARYCSYRCSNDAYIERRRERRKQDRQKQCVTCQADFVGTRSDAKYCSPKCRQSAYRQRGVTGDSCGKFATTGKRNARKREKK